MLQTNQLALEYLKEASAWIKAHPNEIVVFWLSRHGSEGAVGQQQYPGVSIPEKQKFWQDILSIFEGLVFDLSVSSINSTSISTLLERRHRVLFIASDWEQFTNSSIFALDARHLINPLVNKSSVLCVCVMCLCLFVPVCA